MVIELKEGIRLFININGYRPVMVAPMKYHSPANGELLGYSGGSD